MKIYNLKEVVNLLGLNIQTIRQFIKEGRLKASKVGTHYMVTDEAIKEFLKDTQIQPKTEDKEA
jgi:excisionase family DNA binding protein